MPHTPALVLRLSVGPPLAGHPPVRHSCDSVVPCLPPQAGPQLSPSAMSRLSVTAVTASGRLSLVCLPGGWVLLQTVCLCSGESRSQGPVSSAAAPLQVARPERACMKREPGAKPWRAPPPAPLSKQNCFQVSEPFLRLLSPALLTLDQAPRPNRWVRGARGRCAGRCPGHSAGSAGELLVGGLLLRSFRTWPPQGTRPSGGGRAGGRHGSRGSPGSWGSRRPPFRSGRSALLALGPEGLWPRLRSGVSHRLGSAVLWSEPGPHPPAAPCTWCDDRCRCLVLTVGPEERRRPRSGDEDTHLGSRLWVPVLSCDSLLSGSPRSQTPCRASWTRGTSAARAAPGACDSNCRTN